MDKWSNEIEGVPFWVLQRVVDSKVDDWRLYEDGWINESEALRNANPKILGVYVTQHGVVILIPAIAPPLDELEKMFSGG